MSAGWNRWRYVVGIVVLAACANSQPTSGSATVAATGSPTTQYERYLASMDRAGAAYVERPELALGDFRFFEIQQTTIGPPGTKLYRAASSSSAFVGDDWRPLLLSGDAAALAKRVEWLRSPAALASPGDAPSNSREDPRGHGLITAPSVSTAGDGTVSFVAWFVDPPELAPYRVTITAPSSGPARVEVTQAATLLPADPDPLATARAALSSGDVSRKRWALNLLGDAKDRTAVPAMIALLTDPEVMVNSYAAMALGAVGDTSAVPALLAALTTSKDAQVRMHVAIAVTRLNDPGAGPVLAQRLNLDADENVRVQILYALEKLGARDPKLRPAIERAAKDPAVTVRTKAKQMLDAP